MQCKCFTINNMAHVHHRYNLSHCHLCFLLSYHTSLLSFPRTCHNLYFLELCIGHVISQESRLGFTWFDSFYQSHVILKIRGKKSLLTSSNSYPLFPILVTCSLLSTFSILLLLMNFLINYSRYFLTLNFP